MEADTSTGRTITLATLSRNGRALLADAGIDNAEQEVGWILQSALGCSRLTLTVEGDTELTPEQHETVQALLRRRAGREPLQYILGSQEFCGREFTVNPSVLIPRPETELLVETVLEEVEALAGPVRIDPVVADVGTGSGCIAVHLAIEKPNARIYAIDASPLALEVARGNASRFGVAKRITFMEGDLCAPLRDAGMAGRVSVLVSNPPYVAETDWPGIQPEVRLFEPRMALVAGPDGLSVHRKLLVEAAAVLRPGGLFAVEVGAGQARAVREMADDVGTYEYISTKMDHAGIERVLLWRRCG